MAEPTHLCIPAVFQTLKTKTTRLLDPISQAEGLTTLQICVLLHLYKQEATVGDISELTGMGQANTSALCKKLGQAGFLSRQRSIDDGRVVTLALTDKGRAAVDRFQQRMDRYTDLLANLPQELKDDFIRGVAATEQILDYLYEQACAGGFDPGDQTEGE